MERDTRQRRAIRRVFETCGRPLSTREVLAAAHRQAPTLAPRIKRRGWESAPPGPAPGLPVVSPRVGGGDSLSLFAPAIIDRMLSSASADPGPEDAVLRSIPAPRRRTTRALALLAVLV